MPGAAVGIDLGIGGAGQRPVCASFLFEGSRVVDRRAEKWVAEGDAGAYRDQVVRFRGSCGVGGDAELGRRSPEQRWIAERFGSRHEEQPLRLRGQLFNAAP